MLKRVYRDILRWKSTFYNRICNKVDSKMNSEIIAEKNIFNVLGPEVLDTNEKIYTDAITYALENKNVRNIAITGIYGAGKSSIWLSHIKNWQVEKNPIFISLGNYDEPVNSESNQLEGSMQENRIERQIINQILSQINKDKIILSKYNFKKNISFWLAIFKAFFYSIFILSIFVWFYKDDVTGIFNLYIKNWSVFDTSFVSILIFFVSLIFIFYYFIKEYKVKIDKISFKGAEAKFNDSIDTDETIFDRDIKEIVYLLYSSEVECVVFEDLDRYDNINIFTKLRELNFLLNSFILSNKKNYNVKFVYMLRDGLFLSKNRTKFFDFILPVVPIIDSRTSEHVLVELFETINFSPTKDILSKIALYIDDMRLLKNIVNEYKVYSEIIQPEDINLDCNKLFAIITLKNIFPHEFDLLQLNQGYIIEIFSKLESSRKKLLFDLEGQRDELLNQITLINNRITCNQFELMALMIPSSVYITGSESNTPWNEILKRWSEEKSELKSIYGHYGNNFYNYNQFLETYILTSEEKKDTIDKTYEDKNIQIKRLEEKIEKINTKIKKIDIYSYVEILSNMNSQDRENIFTNTTNKIIEDHYFPLIRFLISEGVLDETYEYYKGKINFDKSKLLGKNDVIYLKSLYESKQLDIGFKVNNPKEILSRLSKRDFSRFNILNKYIFKEVLNEGLEDKIILIIKSLDQELGYSNLSKILDEFDFAIIDKFIQSIVTIEVEYLLAILRSCKNNYINAYQRILVALITNKNIDNKYLGSFKEILEENSQILSLIPINRVQTLIKHLEDLNLKFNDLAKSELPRELLIVIENYKAFHLNINNILLITKFILTEDIEYGRLITGISKLECLKSSYEYICANFDVFITDYIESCPEGITYYNDENVLINVFDSKISNELKIKYLSNNKYIITDVAALNITEFDKEVFDQLLITNTLEFNKDNLAYYWKHIESYDEVLVEYLDVNLNDDNVEEILFTNKSICNCLITDSDIDISLFEYLLPFVDKVIEDIKVDLTEEKIESLIKNNLISVTSTNIKYLVDRKYYNEIILLINSVNEIDKSQIISELLNFELDNSLLYEILNSSISLDDAIHLLNLIDPYPLLELININRTLLIKYILNNYLLEDNRKYISNYFSEFEFKDDFIIALNQSGQLLSFVDECNRNTVILYLLNNDNISIEDKIEIIKNKISSINATDLKEYILAIEDVSELASIWDGKYPSVDTKPKEHLAELLVQSGTAKRRKDNKIMLHS